MSTRREQVLEAAIRVLGGGGPRAFTHRAVDAEGGLPPGTTSNHFRTRAALVDAVLGHLGTQDRELCDFYAEKITRIATEGGLAPAAILEMGAAMIRQLLGLSRLTTLARFAISLEAAHRPELREPLIKHSRTWWDLAVRLLSLAGTPDVERRARWALAYFDGLLLDQFCRPDPDFDAEEALKPILFGLISGPEQPD
jgi:AcrR family transcriptional regulator